MWHLLVAFACLTPASASTFTVTNAGDSGPGSLRRQIERANASPGPDTIEFSWMLIAVTISPLTSLPAITDAETTIDGVIVDDAAPDLRIDGGSLAPGEATLISVAAPDCTILDLALTNCPEAGIRVSNAPRCRISGCYVGIDPVGAPAPSGRYDIEMWNSPNSEVGGPNRWTRNVLAGGAPDSPNPSDAGLFCAYSDATLIRGNTFGLTPNGRGALGRGNTGIATLGCENLVIGGTGYEEGNFFGGVRTGVALASTNNSWVQGNRFGLGTDGNQGLDIEDDCLYLSACTGNLIGGASAAARNVFAGNAMQGIRCVGVGTVGNKIRGNYFGLNAGGTKQRRLFYGVLIASGAGYQWIGGTTAETGNCFAARFPIRFGLGAGVGSTIQNNRIGLRADGTDATGVEEGIAIWGSTVRVLNNTIANVTNTGVLSTEAGANPHVYGNTFRNCLAAVRVVGDAKCRLGNLSNASAADDGGNQFDPSNGTHIYNLTANLIRAEGNSFGTTSKAAIDAKIFDKLDVGSLGRVDFVPLQGGVTPTGVASGPLAVTGAAAVPTSAGGAEIAFSLSSPATVTVCLLNLAGRPVATIARGVDLSAGLQRLGWSGVTATGTRAPSGTYLLRIEAQGQDGVRAQAVGTLQLRR